MVVKSFCTTFALSKNSQFFLYTVFPWADIKMEFKVQEEKAKRKGEIILSETNKLYHIKRACL